MFAPCISREENYFIIPTDALNNIKEFSACAVDGSQGNKLGDLEVGVLA
jgi:hypothetical protein